MYIKKTKTNKNYVSLSLRYDVYVKVYKEFPEIFCTLSAAVTISKAMC